MAKVWLNAGANSKPPGPDEQKLCHNLGALPDAYLLPWLRSIGLEITGPFPCLRCLATVETGFGKLGPIVSTLLV